MTGMPPGVNPGRVENWAFDIVQFFPNIVMAVSNHRLMEMQFWPIDVNHTEFIGTVYLYPPKDLGERISQEFVRSRARQVVFEDLNTLEVQHRCCLRANSPIYNCPCRRLPCSTITR